MAKKEEKMPGRLSGAKEILMLLLLGVAGQSWDSYSDLGLSYRFAVGKTYNGKFNNIQSITNKVLSRFKKDFGSGQKVS